MNYKYQYTPQQPGMSPAVKTILMVVTGIVAAFIVVGTIIAIVIMIWVGRAADSVANRTGTAGQQVAGSTNPNSTNSGSVGQGRTVSGPSSGRRVDVNSISPPKTVDEAVEMLRREEWEYHEVAAKWLVKQQVNSSQTDEVAPVLMTAYNQPGQASDHLLDALEKWADRNIAGDLAAELSEYNSENGRILAVLAKLNEPAAAAGIAPLLEVNRYAAQARQIIISLGPQTAPFVAPYLLSENHAAKTHAEQIMEELGLDAEKMLTESLVMRLQDVKAHELSDTFKMLSRMEPTDESREKVGQEILNLARDDSSRFFAGDNLTAALSKWWIPEMISVINEQLESGYNPENQVFELAAEHWNDETISILCNKLKSNRSHRREYTDCLIKIGEPAINSVTSIPAGGRFDEELDDEISRFMKEVNAAPTMVLEREIAAIEQADSSFEVEDAFEFFDDKTPEGMGVDTETHEAVAQAMSEAIKNTGYGIDEDVMSIYRVWVTPTSAAGLISHIEKEHDPNAEDIIRLVELDIPEQSGPMFERLLSQTFKQQKVASTLRRSGPKVQGLCIYMLKTVADTEIAVELVTNLGINGDETCIEPLQELAEVAERRNVTPVARAAREATREIRRRMGTRTGDDSEETEGSGESDN